MDHPEISLCLYPRFVHGLVREQFIAHPGNTSCNGLGLFMAQFEIMAILRSFHETSWEVHGSVWDQFMVQSENSSWLTPRSVYSFVRDQLTFQSEITPCFGLRLFHWRVWEEIMVWLFHGSIGDQLIFQAEFSSCLSRSWIKACSEISCWHGHRSVFLAWS